MIMDIQEYLPQLKEVFERHDVVRMTLEPS